MEDETRLLVTEDNEDQFRRLKEIEEMTSRLRHERATLLRERPWYRKPASWIGILAIVISILLFALNYFISKEDTFLTVSYVEPRPLVLFTASVRSKAELFFDGKPIENIYRTTIYIQNTGSVAIDSDHFKDGPLKFTVSCGIQKGGTTTSGGIPLILDVIQASRAGQQKDVLQINSSNDPAEFTYLPTLLNPGETVELEIYMSEIAKYEFACQGKILNGEIVFAARTDESSEKMIDRPVKAFGTAILSVFGSKWIAIVVTSLVLLLSVTMSLFLFFLAADEDWDWPFVLTFINGIFVCVLFAAGMVVTVIY